MRNSQRRLAAVLVTDVVGYSRLAHRDEAEALFRLEAHNAIATPLFESHGGRIVKSTGDGYLVEFVSVLASVRCALDLQRALRNPGPHGNLKVRIGIHMCDVECVDGDIHGDGVNIAARVQEQADPGGVCITEDVYRQVKGRIEAAFVPMGPRSLKNIDDPITLYRVLDSERSEPDLPPVAVPRFGIAVLPFVNVSSDPENEHFCFGLADELINGLTKGGEWRVLSRTSSFSSSLRDLSLKEIGRILGVGALVEGSVRKSGRRIRVTAQLIDVETDAHLWSDTFDRELEDIFAVQEEITESIVRALRRALGSDSDEPCCPVARVDVRAYELYLRGMQEYARGDLTSYRAARSLFRQAIEIEPDFTRAHAALSQCAAYQQLYWEASPAILEEARRASARAMELAPKQPESQVAHGLTLSLEGRYSEAEDAFREAVRLDPTCYDAWYALGRCLFTVGRYRDSIEAFENAASVRSDDYQSLGLALTAYRALGDEPGRIRTAAAALPVIQRHRLLNPDDARASYFEASIHSILGDRESALRCIAHALELGPDDPSILYNVACVYSLLGMAQESLDHLAKTAAAGFVDLDWIEHDKDLELIKADPRFPQIVAKIRRNREAV